MPRTLEDTVVQTHAHHVWTVEDLVVLFDSGSIQMDWRIATESNYEPCIIGDAAFGQPYGQ
jgi:hypothetical protein